MKMPLLLANLGLLLCLGSVQAIAAPGHDYHDPRLSEGHAERKPYMADREQSKPIQQQAQHDHRPPADFSSLRRSLHDKRQYFGPAKALPRHVHIVKGKPLPHGWGHPLTPAQARHVPHYRGYEWRRAGNDLILISLASGVVFEVLNGVLG